jgi:hypothetical protein
MLVCEKPCEILARDAYRIEIEVLCTFVLPNGPELRQKDGG